MRRSSALVLASFVAIAMFAGCSSGGNDAGSADSGSGTADDAAADEASNDGDESEVSADQAETPIPFPDGVTLELVRTDAGLTLYYPAEDADRIIAFYDDWTSAESDSYERLDVSENSTSWSYVSESDATLRIIAVAENFDGGQNFGTVTSVQLVF